MPSVEGYQADEKTKLAIERCIEIVCEASHKLKKKHAIIMDTHDRAYNFRGSLTHQYDEIKDITVFSFATMDIPIWLRKLKNYWRKISVDLFP